MMVKKVILHAHKLCGIIQLNRKFYNEIAYCINLTYCISCYMCIFRKDLHVAQQAKREEASQLANNMLTCQLILLHNVEAFYIN